MELADIAKIISNGGAAALALVVWMELREHRKEIKELVAQMSKIGITLAKLLERDRQREVKDFVAEEISAVHDMPEKITPPQGVRKRTPPRGILPHVPKSADENGDDK